jgi:hypothetical protein
LDDCHPTSQNPCGTKETSIPKIGNGNCKTKEEMNGRSLSITREETTMTFNKVPQMTTTMVELMFW